MMVVQIGEDKPVYCSECGSIMIKKTEPDTLTAKTTRTLYECPKCNSMLWYGRLIFSNSAGEELEWYTINMGFNHSSNQKVRK